MSIERGCWLMGGDKRRVRATNHHGRIGTAMHNGRTFLSEDGTSVKTMKTEKEQKELEKKAEHIDFSRLRLNEYWFFDCDAKEYSGEAGPGSQTFMTGFEESELRFYKQKFGKSLEMQNERYKAQRHPERKRKMEQVLQTKNKSPVETILQIGDKTTVIPPKVFDECVKEYIQRLQEWGKNHDDCYVLINYAIHHDETSPHAHLRGTFVWYDDDGVAHMGQDEALKRAGIELADPSEERGRRNNRKMTFDRMLREWWVEILESHGYVIEKEPIKGAEHLTVKGYKAKMDAEKEIAEKAAQLKAKEQEIQAKAAELTAREQNIEKEVEARLEDRVKALDKRAAELDAWEKRLDSQSDKLDSRDRLISRKIRELDAEARNIDKVAAARLKEKETALDKAREEVEKLIMKLQALLDKYKEKIQAADKADHPLVAWAKRRKWKHKGETVTIWETYQEEREKEKKAEDETVEADEKEMEKEAQRLIVKGTYGKPRPEERELPYIDYSQQGPEMEHGK